jgi:hypothetical protein
MVGVSTMKGWILNETESMPFHTDMRRIFDTLEGLQLEFNWLITNISYVIDGIRIPSNRKLSTDISNGTNTSNYPTDALDKEIVWIEGDELNKIIYGNSIQFIWAVFTGVRKGIQIDVKNLEVEPYSDGNPGFWTTDPTIQLPQAEIEIVCWDSTLTLFLSNNTDIANKFKNHFKDAKDLREYNQES